MNEQINSTLATPEIAGELIRLRHRIDAAEARWMTLLVEFDRREGWKADGHLSTVD